MKRCFACDKRLGNTPRLAVTEDGQQLVYVGSECFKAISAAGKAGYQPPLGGPRLLLTLYVPLAHGHKTTPGRSRASFI